MTLLGRQSAVAYQNLLLIDEVSHTKILFESLLENLSGGLVAIGLDGKNHDFKSVRAAILKLSSADQIGQPAKEVLKAAAWFLETLWNTLSSKSTVSRQETQQTLHGEPSRIGYTTILIKDPQKIVLGAGIIFQKLAN